MSLLRKKPRRESPKIPKMYRPLAIEVRRAVRELVKEDPRLVREAGPGEHAMTDTCYFATEALFHLARVEHPTLRALLLKDKHFHHWWLEDSHGRVLDITADQFTRPVPYEKGQRRGFMHPSPSKRA